MKKTKCEVTHLIVINVLQKLGHFRHMGQKRLFTYTNELCAVVPCIVSLVEVQSPQKVNNSTPTSEIIIMQLNDLLKVLPYKQYYFWRQKEICPKTTGRNYLLTAVLWNGSIDPLEGESKDCFWTYPHHVPVMNL